MKISIVSKYRENSPELIKEHATGHLEVMNGILSKFESNTILVFHDTHIDADAVETFLSKRKLVPNTWDIICFANSLLNDCETPDGEATVDVAEYPALFGQIMKDMNFFIIKKMEIGKLEYLTSKPENIVYGEINREKRIVFLWVDLLHGKDPKTELIFSILDDARIISQEEFSKFKEDREKYITEERLRQQQELVSSLIEIRKNCVQEEYNAMEKSAIEYETESNGHYQDCIALDIQVLQIREKMLGLDFYLKNGNLPEEFRTSLETNVQILLAQKEIQSVEIQGSKLVVVTKPISLKRIEIPSRTGPPTVKLLPEGKYIMGSYEIFIPIQPNVELNIIRREGSVHGYHHPHIRASGEKTSQICWGSRRRDNLRNALLEWDLALYAFYVLDLLRTTTLNQEYRKLEMFLEDLGYSYNEHEIFQEE